MKKVMLFLMAVCILLAGCGKVKDAETQQPEQETVETEQAPTADAEQAEPAATVQPLPDTTMENLTDAVLSISLEEGGAFESLPKTTQLSFF